MVLRKGSNGIIQGGLGDSIQVYTTREWLLLLHSTSLHRTIRDIQRICSAIRPSNALL